MSASWRLIGKTRLRIACGGKRIMRIFLAGILLGSFCVPAAAAPADDRKSEIPDLGVLWAKAEDEYFKAPKNGPGPPISLPLMKGVHYEADYRSPVLQPWVAETLKKYQEMDRAAVALPPNVMSTCRPSGVPGAMAPHYVLDLIQTPTMVVFLYNNNDQIRYVYLDQPHSKNITPSWYGESVGHYEGDTLVVDTIGLAGKDGKSVIDTFGTPHTDALHIIERYHLINGGNTLRVDIHVEDPGAFTVPFDMYFNLARIKSDPFPAYIGEERYAGAFEERICAANNRSVGVADMPIADKPDF
jgi:hypothetical protein